MCPMFHPVHGANNVFLTHPFLLHYISHSANSEWVQRGELGPYGRLKCSKSHRINLESLRWATQRPLQKSISKILVNMVSMFFFPIHPLIYYTLIFSLFFEKRLQKVLQKTKNHTSPDNDTTSSQNGSIYSTGIAQTISMSSIYQQSIPDSLDINNESQLLTFVQKMQNGMSRFLEATKSQARPSHYNKMGWPAAQTKRQHKA